MKIAMIGSGYVGLVTGAGLAEFGNDVTCVDADEGKVAKLQAGVLPIYEPGLDQLVEDNLKVDRIRFTTDVKPSIASADVVFITVGTPQSADGSANLSQVFSVAHTIGDVLADSSSAADSGKVVVVKSTVPVGTTAKVEQIISTIVGVKTAVANNPEFLREGTAVQDFMRPDRIVVGTSSAQAKAVLLRLYRPFTNVTSVLTMDSTSSELVKYASNSLLATRVSFMNELANLTAVLGADVDRVREGLGADHRIGPKYLYPGPGYGGSCFPKDVAAMLYTAESVGVPLRVVLAAQEANAEQRHVLGRLVLGHFGFEPNALLEAFGGDWPPPRSLDGKIVAVWGAAFKAETDDVRDSPALAFIDDMLAAGARVRVHDPQALGSVRSIYGDRVKCVDDMYSALDGADVLALCTEWRQYRTFDFSELRRRAPVAAVFDGRNIWEPAEFRSRGIPYYGIGRGSPAKERAQ